MDFICKFEMHPFTQVGCIVSIYGTQAIALDPGVKTFACRSGVDISTIFGTQAAQIDREAVPEYQLAEAFLIEFDGEIALRIGGNLDGQGIFRSFHVKWYWFHDFPRNEDQQAAKRSLPVLVISLPSRAGWRRHSERPRFL